MKVSQLVLFMLITATALAQENPAAARPLTKSPPRSHASCDCEQTWDQLIQVQQAELTDLNNEIGGLRALTTMLRSDAGTVPDTNVRDALQVNADMWETHISNLQKHVVRLQGLIEEEKAKQQIQQHGKTSAPRDHR